MPIGDFIITVYCVIDDLLKETLGEQSLRERGFTPSLTDSEVITMEIVAEFLSIDTDKGAWKYFVNHWKKLFPKLGSHFAKHASNLWNVKQALHKHLAQRLGAFSDFLHLADGFPLPVCHFKRAYFSEIFKGEAAYGYCASKEEKYYGLKGNVLISSEGVITDLTVTAANIDERESLWDVIKEIAGMIIADKGLIGKDYREELYHYTGLDLQTAVCSNMQETRSEEFIKWLVSTRRLVETVIGQLTDRFNIEKIRARKTWHLTNRIARKILSHTVCVFINKMCGNPPLQFDSLIKIAES